MNKTQINKGNRLIAEFMGYKYTDGMKHIEPKRPKVEGIHKNSYYMRKDGASSMLYQLDYHEDWNRLMPVIKKICPPKGKRDVIKNAMITILPIVNGCSIQYNFRLPSESAKDACDRIKVVKEPKLIWAVWKAVVQWIAWYNENK